jgi:hypothetical protein
MLVGYMRVSKADGSQTLELQRDALLAAGVTHLYDDHASGRSDDRPAQRLSLKRPNATFLPIGPGVEMRVARAGDGWR